MKKIVLFIIFTFSIISGCKISPAKKAVFSDREPLIEPDYSGITIPPNIAPLNFAIKEDASGFFTVLSSEKSRAVKIRSGKGKIRIPQKKWARLLDENKGGAVNIDIFIRKKKGGWERLRRISNHISAEPIDPYLTFRVIYPGYESWEELSIMQRSLESFSEKPVIENSLVDQNCVNCHSFNNGNSQDFLYHMRGSLGGTYFYRDGEFRKVNLKIEKMKNSAVYPRWHPSGNFVAFSSNKIVQQFHSVNPNRIEVSDLESSMVLYDVRRNEMSDMKLEGWEESMDTYPEWSPDGNYLYFCRAKKAGQVFVYSDVHYNLFRVPFDQSSRKTGKPELVFDASAMGKSVSFPRISPDGKYVAVTLHNYGCFPIWHREADIYLIDLATMDTLGLQLNSDKTDSYHSWSSNGRWMAFSSRRSDGLTTRIYISGISSDGSASKPFIVPQQDPEFYDRFLKSYNVPELSNLRIRVKPGKMRKIAEGKAIQAGWSD